MMDTLPSIFGVLSVQSIRLHVAVVLAATLLQLPLRMSQAQTAASPSQVSREVAKPVTIDGFTPAELLRQLTDSKFSPEQIASVAAEILRLQADEKIVWDTHWGDFLKRAHERGTLPEKLWNKYVLGIVQVDVKIAVETKRADGLAVQYEFKRDRGGENFPDVILIGWQENEFSGVKLDPYRNTGQGILYDSLTCLSGVGWTEKLSDKGYASLKPGPQTYHYRYHVGLFNKLTFEKEEKPTPLGERIIEGELHWTLLADDQAVPAPKLIVDESLRPAVESCLHVSASRDTRDTSLVKLMIQVDHPPIGMGFNVYFQAGGRKLFVGPVAWSTEIGWWAFDIDIPPEIKAVDLYFTPSTSATTKLKRRNGVRLIGLASIWDGEVVLRNVGNHSQRLDGMTGSEPPSFQYLLEDETEQLDGDASVIQQFKRDGDIATAHRQLERQALRNPTNASVLFNLGCMAVVSRDWGHATDCFAKILQIDSTSSLADKAQSQLRQIGGFLVYLASRGDAGAMCGLGMMYERGWGPKSDPQEAKRWYRNAANAENAEAMCRLASMYERDLAAGQSNPKVEAWYKQQIQVFYQKVADLGNTEAKKWVAAHDQH